MAIENPTSGAPRNSVIDVIRGLAVTLVVLYHLPGKPMQAGLIGVDLFMVMSGYLVTRNLINNQVGWSQVIDFWRRRARRVIAPAMTLVCIVLLVRGFTLQLSPRDDYWDGASAVGFVANWRFIASDTDYFRTVAGVSPFQHLWSLSVEEQFYLVWPIVVLLIKKRLVEFVLGVAILSFAWMAVLSYSDSFSRAYFGTDSRAGTLLIGALLAICGEQFKSIRVLYQPKSLEVLICIFVVVAFSISGMHRYMYRGGFLVVALISAAIVLTAANCSSNREVIFSSRRLFQFLHYIGQRSFSIYLVHWPIFVMFSSSRVSLNRAVEIIVLVIATFVCAEILYRSVEVRWTQRYGFRKFLTTKLLSASVLLVVALLVGGAIATSLPKFLQGGSNSKISDVAVEGKRVLIVGDSIVQSFADLGFGGHLPTFNLDYVAISGCGLLPGLVVDGDRRIYEASRTCEDRAQFELWDKIAPNSYDVVLWLNAWDAEDRQIDDRFLSQVDDSDEFRDIYSQMINRLKSIAQRVVVITVPEKAESSQFDKQTPSASVRARYLAATRSLKSSAQKSGAIVLDLNEHVCQGLTPCKDISSSGQRFRPIDGIHFSGPGGEEALQWLHEQIAEVITN